ncbi:YoaK family protein [Mucilaginibacter endophyticus]|uniref:YoaK family protein n=1 Tax=Mucilaginibacter endophyticus TaxID=2675003 RepID=UPI000E0CE7DD|nr:YoaK family protein [Mucilaginibacter endophyticus]
MENQHNIWFVTLILSAVAGYCDTVTFVSAGSIFSAHVTGNFIVFAYQIIKGSDAQAWIKLLTFPVFMISVIVGGQIAARSVNHYKILLAEGLVLLLCGLISQLFVHTAGLTWETYLVVMLVVFAMGLQNAFGKLYAKETFGPTTMMTGNVTQLSLDLGKSAGSVFKDLVSMESLKKQCITIGGFLAGCLAGAVLAKSFGLMVIVLPGAGIIFCYFVAGKNEPVTAV